METVLERKSHADLFLSDPLLVKMKVGKKEVGFTVGRSEGVYERGGYYEGLNGVFGGGDRIS